MYGIIHECCHFRAYFLAHPIKVLMEQPLRGMLHKPDLPRRLVKWAIKLSAFNITFSLAVIIKGQAVANILAELTHKDLKIPWVVEVDGSSCNIRSRIGIKIQSLDGRNYKHYFRLLFPSRNNMAKYEAVPHGLKMLHSEQSHNWWLVKHRVNS